MKRKMRNRPHSGEAKFVAELMVPGTTKVQAARRAGLSYVPHGKRVEKLEQQLIQKQLTAADITVERIVVELGRIAFFDPARMFDENGDLKRIIDMDEDTRAAIQGFDVEKRQEGRGEDASVYYVLKPRMYSKNQALEILSRMEKLPGMKGQKGPLIMPQVVVNFVDAPKELTA